MMPQQFSNFIGTDSVSLPVATASFETILRARAISFERRGPARVYVTHPNRHKCWAVGKQEDRGSLYDVRQQQCHIQAR